MVPFKVCHIDLPNDFLGPSAPNAFIPHYSSLKTALSGAVWALRSHSTPVSVKVLFASYLGYATDLTPNVAWYLQGNFLYTVLIVGFDESIKSATRIASLYRFFYPLFFPKTVAANREAAFPR
jgi:hypothetical protein